LGAWALQGLVFCKFIFYSILDFFSGIWYKVPMPINILKKCIFFITLPFAVNGVFGVPTPCVQEEPNASNGLPSDDEVDATHACIQKVIEKMQELQLGIPSELIELQTDRDFLALKISQNTLLPYLVQEFAYSSDFLAMMELFLSNGIQIPDRVGDTPFMVFLIKELLPYVNLRDHLPDYLSFFLGRGVGIPDRVGDEPFIYWLMSECENLGNLDEILKLFLSKSVAVPMENEGYLLMAIVSELVQGSANADTVVSLFSHRDIEAPNMVDGVPFEEWSIGALKDGKGLDQSILDLLFDEQVPCPLTVDGLPFIVWFIKAAHHRFDFLSILEKVLAKVALIPEEFDEKYFSIWLIESMAWHPDFIQIFEFFLNKGMRTPQDIEGMPFEGWLILRLASIPEFQGFLERHPNIQGFNWSAFTLIGLAHSQPQFMMDAITRLTEYLQDFYKNLLIPVINADTLKYVPIEAFSGFIIPGAKDTYKLSGKDEITWGDMKDPNPDEALYQYIYSMADQYQIPTFGLCAGAQHLALYHKGRVIKAVEGEGLASLYPYTWPHYMALSPEKREQLVYPIQMDALETEVQRMHSYAVHPMHLGEGVELNGHENGVPMALSRSFWNVATQYHPEADYMDAIEAQQDFSAPITRGQSYSMNMLDYFFNQCFEYHAAVQKALSGGQTREDGIKAWAKKRQSIDNWLKQKQRDSVALSNSKPKPRHDRRDKGPKEQVKRVNASREEL
jgi:anthranilate/para-aminobenzoate synthase component II